MDGLILATFLSGLMLVAVGFLRLGTYVKFIPYPVTVGFTAGIAVIIFASQLKELFGLTLEGPEPGPLLEKLPVLLNALPGASPASIGLAGATILVIVGLKRWRPHWPGLLLAVVGAGIRGLCSRPAGGDNRNTVRRHSLGSSRAGAARTLAVQGS